MTGQPSACRPAATQVGKHPLYQSSWMEQALQTGKYNVIKRTASRSQTIEADFKRLMTLLLLPSSTSQCTWYVWYEWPVAPVNTDPTYCTYACLTHSHHLLSRAINFTTFTFQQSHLPYLPLHLPHAKQHTLQKCLLNSHLSKEAKMECTQTHLI